MENVKYTVLFSLNIYSVEFEQHYIMLSKQETAKIGLKINNNKTNICASVTTTTNHSFWTTNQLNK